MAQAEAPATLVIPIEDGVARLPETASLDSPRVNGLNIEFVQPDGTVIVIPNGAVEGFTIFLGNTEVPPQAIAALFEANGIETAQGADGSQSSGGNFTVPPGGIGSGLLWGNLLPPTGLAFGGLGPSELGPVNDKPRFISLLGDFALDEEGLRKIGGAPFDGNDGPSYPSDEDIPGSVRQLFGSFIVNYGADGPNASEAIVLSAPGATWQKTSALSGVLTGPDGAWTIAVDYSQSGAEYTFNVVVTLHKPSTHTGIDVEDSFDFDVTVLVRDTTNDEATDTFNVLINDDAPVADDPAEQPSYVADEDDIDTHFSQGNHPEDGNVPDGSYTGNPDNAFGGPAFLFGNLVSTGAVKFGADGPEDDAGKQAFSFDNPFDVGTLEQNLQGLGLKSHGDALYYVIDNSPDGQGWITLTAFAEAGVFDRPVFLLKVRATDTDGNPNTSNVGDFEFYLKDQLDHDKPYDDAGDQPQIPGDVNPWRDQNFDLQETAVDADGQPIDLNSLPFGYILRAVDDDGDGIFLNDAFRISVRDDVPKLVDCAPEKKVVNEDDIKTWQQFNDEPGSLGTSPNDGNADGSFTDSQFNNGPGPAVVSGSLAHLVSVGADEVYHGGKAKFSFVADQDIRSYLNGLGLSSQGKPLSYEISNGKIVAFVQFGIGDNGNPTGYTDYGTDDRRVFELTLDVFGNYSFKLFDQIDHDPPYDTNPQGFPSDPFPIPGDVAPHRDQNTDLMDRDDPNGPQRVFDVSELNFGKLIKATDYDGDSIILDGAFKIAIRDDIPELISRAAEHRTVDEDDIKTSKSTGNYPEDGATEDGSFTGSANIENGGPATITGDLAALFKVGADEHKSYGLKFTFVDAADAIDDLRDLGLTSQGDQLYYDIDIVGANTVLYAYANKSNPTGNYNGSDRLVFKLTLEPDGDYKFELWDQLDHDKPSADADENFDLEDTLPGEGDVDFLDFGKLIKATDFDGDSIVLDGVFKIDVRDDIPKLNGEAKIEGIVEEEHKPYGKDYLQDGNEDFDNAGSDDLDKDHVESGDFYSFTTNVTSGTGINSLMALVQVGADEKGLWSLDDSVETADGILDKAGNPVFSAGDAVSISKIEKTFDGASLTSTTIEASADGKLVFKLTIDADGDWQFELFRQLDHHSVEDADDVEGILELDFSSFLKFTDFDGDSISLNGSTFLVKTIDDVPEARIERTESGGLIVDESLDGNTSPGDGNEDDEDDASSNPFPDYGSLIGYVQSGSGSLFAETSSIGADQAGSKAFSLELEFGLDDSTNLKDSATNIDILLKVVDGNVIGYFMDGPTEYVSFVITADADDGEVRVYQYRAVEHNDSEDGDESSSPEILNSGLVFLKVTVTDEDGDKDDARIDIGAVITFEDSGVTANDDRDELDEGKTTSGNVLTGLDDDSLNLLAADDQGTDLPSTISKLVHNGVTYTLSADGSSVSASSGSHAYDSLTGKLTISTALGGQLVIDLKGADIGDYTYTAPANVTSTTEGDVQINPVEAFTYTLTDSDGDHDDAILEIEVVDVDTPFEDDTATSDGPVEEEHLSNFTAQVVNNVQGSKGNEDGAELESKPNPDSPNDTDSAPGSLNNVDDVAIINLAITGGDGPKIFRFNVADGTPVLLSDNGLPLLSKDEAVFFVRDTGNPNIIYGVTNEDGDADSIDADDRIVFRIELDPTGTQDSSGAATTATFTLIDQIDHHAYAATEAGPALAVDDIEGTVTIALGGVFRVEDEDYAQIPDPVNEHVFQNVGVQVIDDVPVAISETANASVGEVIETKLDLLIVLDVSGSMNTIVQSTTKSRLELAREALDQLVGNPDVGMVRIVQFSGSASGTAWMTREDAIDFIATSIASGGGTNYDAALQVAINQPFPATGNDRFVLFLSDGEPNAGISPSPAGIQSGEEDAWISYLTGQSVTKSFAIGFGALTTGNQSNIEPFGWQPGEATGTYPAGGTDPNIILIPGGDLPNLAGILLELITPIDGNVLDNGDAYGADENGHIASISIAGVGPEAGPAYVYTFNPDTGVVTIPAGAPGTVTGTKLVVETGDGGTFTFYFADTLGGIKAGDWHYAPPATAAASFDEAITYRLVDRDGDGADAVLTIKVSLNPPTVIDGEAAVAVQESDLDPTKDTGDLAGGAVTGTTPAGTDETHGDTLTFKAGSLQLTEFGFVNLAGIAITGLGVPVTDITWTVVATAAGDLQVGDLVGTIGTATSPAVVLRLSGGPIDPSQQGDINVAVTLTDAFPHADGVDEIVVSGVTVQAAAAGGLTPATGTVAITIYDDEPIANDDADQLDNETNSASGNVITGADTTTPSAGKDAEGADGAKVLGVVSDEEPGNTATELNGVLTIVGKYGTLVLEADGDYTYTRSGTEPTDGAVSESFTYTLTDSDNDPETAKLTITIDDAGVTIGGLAVEGGEKVLDEDDLPAGSQALPKDALTETGTFVVTAANGVASLTIEGNEVLGGGFPGTDFVLDTPLGELRITNFAAGPGANEYTVSYSYTLQVRAAHASGNGENSVDEQFAVIVTDNDGDLSNATLDIRVVDDVPTVSISPALADNTPTTDFVAEGGTIEGSWSLTEGADGVADADFTISIDGGSPVAVVLNAGILVPGKGTLTILDTGKWTFTALDGIDTDPPLEVSFTLSAVDGDSDPTSDTHTITIGDVAGQVVSGTTALSVAEEGLDGIGSDDPEGSTEETASTVAGGATGDDPLSFAAGSDALTVQFVDPSGQPQPGAGFDPTTFGLPPGTLLVWTYGSGGTDKSILIGSVDNTQVIQLTLSGDLSITANQTGIVTVTATLFDQTPHAFVTSEKNNFVITGIKVEAVDVDSPTLNATVDVTVVDDIPTVTISYADDAPTDNQAFVFEGGAEITGAWTHEFGADDRGTIDLRINTNGLITVVFDPSGNYVVPVAGHGTLTIKNDGTWTFLPEASIGAPSSFSFALRVTDREGDFTETTGFTINVSPANDNTPVGNNDAITVAESGTATILVSAAASVLANDTDADLPADTLTAILVDGPTHANSFVLNADGTFSYQHDGSETLADSFTYTPFDGVNTGAPVTVSITITPQNDNTPVGNNDAITVAESGTATILVSAAASVLANDTDADLPADTLTAILVDGPTHANSFVLNADGTFSYQHDGSETLADSFTYTPFDGVNTGAPVTVSITITPQNDAPTAVTLINTTTSIDENTDTTAGLKVADIVVTDDAMGTETLGLTGADAGLFEIVGTELRLKDGLLNFEAKSSYAIQVTANDTTIGGDPDATSATFTVTINDLFENTGPVAVNDRIVTNAGSAGFVVPEWALLANDTDIDFDTLDVTGVSNQVGLTTTFPVSNGVQANDTGAAGGSFDYAITDGTVPAGATATVTQDTSGSIDGNGDDNIVVAGAWLAPQTTRITFASGNYDIGDVVSITLNGLTYSHAVTAGTRTAEALYDALKAATPVGGGATLQTAVAGLAWTADLTSNVATITAPPGALFDLSSSITNTSPTAQSWLTNVAFTNATGMANNESVTVNINGTNYIAFESISGGSTADQFLDSAANNLLATLNGVSGVSATYNAGTNTIAVTTTFEPTPAITGSSGATTLPTITVTAGSVVQTAPSVSTVVGSAQVTTLTFATSYDQGDIVTITMDGVGYAHTVPAAAASRTGEAVWDALKAVSAGGMTLASRLAAKGVNVPADLTANVATLTSGLGVHNAFTIETSVNNDSDVSAPWIYTADFDAGVGSFGSSGALAPTELITITINGVARSASYDNTGISGDDNRFDDAAANLVTILNGVAGLSASYDTANNMFTINSNAAFSTFAATSTSSDTTGTTANPQVGGAAANQSLTVNTSAQATGYSEIVTLNLGTANYDAGDTVTLTVDGVTYNYLVTAGTRAPEAVYDALKAVVAGGMTLAARLAAKGVNMPPDLTAGVVTLVGNPGAANAFSISAAVTNVAGGASAWVHSINFEDDLSSFTSGSENITITINGTPYVQTSSGGSDSDVAFDTAANALRATIDALPDVTATFNATTNIFTISTTFESTAAGTSTSNDTAAVVTTTVGSVTNAGPTVTVVQEAADGFTLNGLGGDDVLIGGGGDDFLSGGAGDDILYGGLGSDTLTGGADADTFRLSNNGNANADLITDYDFGEGDKIDISELLVGFSGDETALAEYLQVTQNGNDVVIAVDTNGATGGANFVTVATLVDYGTASPTDSVEIIINDMLDVTKTI